MKTLKPLTDTAWILQDEAKGHVSRIGILTFVNGAYRFTSPSFNAEFENEESVNLHFKENVFNISLKTETEKHGSVNGYPSNAANPVVFENAASLPLYTKTAESKVVFAAGYYSIQFPGGYTVRYSPRYDTVLKYKYAGPFKTEFEAKAHAQLLNSTST